MKIAFAAGGTGGHLYPALVTAIELRRRNPALEALFMVSRKGRERKILGEHGFRAEELPATGFGPAASPGAALAAARVIWSCVRAARLMREERVEGVVGFGAYVSAGPVLAARGLRLRIVIHEQNAVMGRTNRWLMRFADSIAVGLPLLEAPRRPCVRTGIPLRPWLREGIGRKRALRYLGLDERRFTLLVMGGSQGARAVNILALEAAGGFAGMGDIQAIHLSGARDYGRVLAGYARAGLPAVVFPFLDEMEWAYAAADIAISRCGAMTLAEIAMAGLPSILIPYPHAADGHQSANATVFEREGAAIVWEEARLWAGALSAIVRDLKGNPSALGAMADAAKALAVPDAAERLAGLIEETMHLGRAV